MHTEETDPNQRKVLASIRLNKCDVVAEALDHFSKGLVVGSNQYEETSGAPTPELASWGRDLYLPYNQTPAPIPYIQ